ncbi:MAG: AsmA-like C-terminal region-containing protein [Muribaculaceae bacterium]|nr:AsmA-like C-terminal region-containing protein [Muribaculaceae bacterium]
MSKNIIFKKTLRVFLWVVFSLLSLSIVVMTLIVWVLSPSQLTPLAQKYANEFLDADVKLARVELTFWRSFPYATIDVDSVEIISHAFDSIPDSLKELPQYRDTLLTIDKFHGGVNVLKLITGKIAIGDVMFIGPRVNVVAYSAKVANCNIVAPSDEPFVMPDLSINSIEITHCKGINYISMPDSTEIGLDITAAQVNQPDNGKLQLLLDAFVSYKTGNVQSLNRLPLNINGIMDWNIKNPLKVSVEDWKMKVGSTPMMFTLNADFTNSVKINKFNMELGEIDFSSFRNYIAPEYLRQVEGLETNMRATLKLALKEPYDMNNSFIPSLTAELDIPDSYMKGSNGDSLDNFTANVSADIDGKELNKSVVNLNRFIINGKSLNLSIKGKATEIMSNPRLTGEIICDADIKKVIKTFRIPIQYKVSGSIVTNSKFDVSVNDVKAQQYQRIGVHGDLKLSNFKVISNEDSLYLYTHKIAFKLGSQEKFKNIDTKKVSNIMKATFSLDSLKMNVGNMDLTIIDGIVGAGASDDIANWSNKKKRIIPFGAVVKSKKIRFVDADSSRMRFTDMICKITSKECSYDLTRPILNFSFDAKRASYHNSTMRSSLRDADIKVTLSPRVRRSKAAIDSLRNLYPKLSDDSLRAIYLKSRKRKRVESSGEKLDLSVDSGLKNALKNWVMEGSLKSSRVRLLTPYFPLRNTINDVDLTFSLDSFIVNKGYYRVGNSIFDISGGVRDMRTTMMGRNTRPLKIDFNIISDTLDVNELIATAFKGTAYADSKVKQNMLMGNEDSDNVNLSSASDTIMRAFVIPSNVDVDIDVLAKHAVYADMQLKDLQGCFQVHDGAMQFNNVKTNSDAGNLHFNALYAAKDKENIRFAFDLGMEAIQLDRFIKLIPQVDSIMPLLKSMDGVIKADIIATTDVDSLMNVKLPTLTAAIKLHGDSLVLFDSKTFASISKMLRFKNKERNLIDDMTVELLIKDNTLQLFPFVFNMDRYKVGIMGHNDLSLNLDYHISVLKSPIPFKFGLNIKGTPDNLKYTLGKARYKEGKAGEVTSLVDNTRINLRQQIAQVFRRGANAALNSKLRIADVKVVTDSEEKFTHEDSLKLIKEGLIEAPKPVLTPKQLKEQKKKEAKEEKDRKRKEKQAAKLDAKSKAVRKD